MLSFQLYVSGDNRGSLNLYNSSPDAFSDESEHVGLLLASHTAIAMASAQQEENLLHAIAALTLSVKPRVKAAPSRMLST